MIELLWIVNAKLYKNYLAKERVYEKAEKHSRTCGNRIVIHYTFQAGSGQRADAVTDKVSEIALLPHKKQTQKAIVPFGLHTSHISPLRITDKTQGLII